MALGCGEAGRFCLAALVGVLFASSALADGDDDEPDPAKVVFFGSLEAGPGKSFMSYGAKRAVGADGLDASGFRLMDKLGVARERASRIRPYGRAYKVEAQFLIGYELLLGSSALSLYAGSDFEGDYREVWYGAYGIARTGMRVHADFWSTPSSTTMAQASAYVSTLDHRAWGRLALGHKVGRGLYLGPEIEVYRQADYHQMRSGVHLTGLRLFGATWRLSAGWQDASGHAPGAYATLGAHWTEPLDKWLRRLFVAPFRQRPAILP